MVNRVKEPPVPISVETAPDFVLGLADSDILQPLTDNNMIAANR